jgi:hypothetical protein
MKLLTAAIATGIIIYAVYYFHKKTVKEIDARIIPDEIRQKCPFTFRVGDQINHERFGEVTIISLQRQNGTNNITFEAQFETGEIKKFVTTCADQVKIN